MNKKRTNSDERDQWLRGYCAGCLPHECGIRVRLKDDVVIEIEGDPNFPSNQGKLCVRGALTSIPGLYSPSRIKKPLRRTNPKKGLDEDPAWVEMEWDEALDVVSARLKRIREDDPRKFVFVEGWGTCAGRFGREVWLPQPDGYNKFGSIFTLAHGTPNLVGSHGPLCAIHYSSNLVHGVYPEQIADVQYCRYLIATGRTVGPNSGSVAASKRFLDAIDRGLKLVVIDPRCSVEASKAYRWVPIRPGTELAFALSMVHVILYEMKTFDEWFVKNRTNGPYLIQEDGYYYRDPETANPMIWDQEDHQAKVFSDDALKDPALDGEYEVNGQKVSPAFYLMKKEMANYFPEWAEDITTVPAETIRTITKEFVAHADIDSTIEIDGFEFPFRPSQFSGSGRGSVNHKNGMLFDLTGKIINLLVGAVEVPGGFTGGWQGPGPDVLKPDKDGVVTPILEAIGHKFSYPPNYIDGAEFFPTKHTTPTLMAKNIIDPSRYHLNYEVDTLFLFGANPIRSTCEPQIYEEAFRKVPFMVAVSPQLDESTVMADVVLPNSHFLECKGLKVWRPALQSVDDDLRGLLMVMGRNPVPKLHDTLDSDEILLELADRGGFLKGEGGLNDYINQAHRLEGNCKLDLDKKYDLVEIWDHIIKQIFGDKYDYDYLMEHGCLYKYTAKGREGYNYYYWPDNKTRHPIYFNRLKETGDTLKKNLEKHGITHPGYKDDSEFFKYFQPVPFWIPTDEFLAPEEYDLYVINWKTNFRIHGMGSILENAWIKEIRDKDAYETYVMINAETAKNKGLQDEDRVCIESRYGKTEGKLRVSELIHPEVIGIPGNYGGKSASFLNPITSEAAWYNELLSSGEEHSLEPITAGIENAPKVKIYRIE
ncbi:MAG: molybdopterin-dependent oxidoreductase [Deltaproteobacteria bacterium]|nr:molybdopterin-dependent oxidoreductase [Deltaproteobacteria bacterium]